MSICISAITSILYSLEISLQLSVHSKEHLYRWPETAQSSRGPLREINTAGARKCLPLPFFLFFLYPCLGFSAIFNHFASSYVVRITHEYH